MGSNPSKTKRPSISEPIDEPVFVRSSSAPNQTPTIVVEQIDQKPPTVSKRPFKKKSSSVKPMMTKSDSVNADHGFINQTTSSSRQSPKRKDQRSLSVNALNFVPPTNSTNQTPFSNPGSVLGSPPPSRGYKTIKNRCYYCGAADHSHEQCTKGEPVECQKCGERGHMEKFCDRFHMN